MAITTFTSIAWGNMLRNRRRTVSTLLAITIGVTMLVFTNAFTNGISHNMSSTIIDQIDAHLRIEHKDYKKFFITDQERILITKQQDLTRKILSIPHVSKLMPRVMLGGLIGIDDKSSTFFGTASDLATLSSVLPSYGLNLRSGKLLDPEDGKGILLGQALADSLQVKVGDELILLSKTIHGDQSSSLVQVRGTLTFPTDYLAEQSLVLTGLGKEIREDLLDLGENATQLLVRVDDLAHVAQTAAEIERYFTENKLPFQVIPWFENPSYSRIVGVFDGIGGLIMFILLMMVGIITSNALLMTFFERMREIGSMRAVGMSQFQVTQLLFIESAMIALIGTIAGLLLGLIAVGLARLIGIPLGLIGQDIYPFLSFKMLLISTLAPVIFILLAALIPIRAANKLSVVESLNYQ